MLIFHPIKHANNKNIPLPIIICIIGNKANSFITLKGLLVSSIIIMPTLKQEYFFDILNIYKIKNIEQITERLK